MASDNETVLLSSKSIVGTLDFLMKRVLIHLPLVLTIIGLIGFSGNAFVFLQPKLRRNSFCIYTLCGSFVDITNLFVNLLPNYFSNTGGTWASASSSIECKFIIFSSGFLPQLSLNLLILSLIDRYACTCSLTARIRRIRQLKMVPWFIFFTVLATFLQTLHTFFFYDIIPYIGCASKYPLSDGIIYITYQGISAPLLMIVLVLLSYRNIKKSQQRVVAVNRENQINDRTQFIGMIFVQIFVTSFFTLQWIIMYLYYLIIRSDEKSVEEWFIIYFCLALTNNLFYVNHVKSFFLSTLTSHTFRTTFKTAFIKLLSQCLPREWLVAYVNTPVVVGQNISPNNAANINVEHT